MLRRKLMGGVQQLAWRFLAIISFVAMFFLAASEVPLRRPPLSLPVAPATLGGTDNAAGRAQYEWLRTRDPATGSIPLSIRVREQVFAARLPNKESLAKQKAQGLATPAAIGDIDWQSRGPINVGGRSRALAVDVAAPGTLLAGGVSGGMWRSTDGGTVWTLTTGALQLHSVTCVAQDTRSGKSHIWYYGTGELRGNSASGGGAPYRGDGVFKSTDGGLSWSQLSSTASGTPQTFDQMFDYVWNLAVDPSSPTPELYAATVGGINRSTDGGSTWVTVLGGFSSDSPRYTDVSVTTDGVVYATLSTVSINGASGAAAGGIWRSPDGLTWTRITSPSWPNHFRRVVIGIAPSDENTVYFLGDTPGAGFQTVFADVPEGHSLGRYQYLSGDGTGGGGMWQDLTGSLPALGGQVGDFASQQSFDLTVAVKPDDVDVVYIGGTNLYRSTNGFSDPSSTALIGGYAGPNDLSMYPNHHADQHVLCFHPEQPNVLFSGHDGGVSVTANATAETVVWQSLSRGYATTQYFTLAIDRTLEGDNAILGGMQDNGTWMTNGAGSTVPWFQLAGGDGSFCAIAPGRTSYYVSSQNGVVYRLLLNTNGSLAGLARVDPSGGEGYLFINPFVLDPGDSRVMYMAGGRSLWRNSDLLAIPLGNREPTSVGWTNLEAAGIQSGVITALGVSRMAPEHRLYYGTSRGRVFVLDGAHAATSMTPSRDITTGLPNDAYVSCIAVDPEDGDHVLSVFSNYSILSLFSTHDGGLSWEQVAGNLEEFPDGRGSGPSVRWAAIQRNNGGTVYFVGTSTGLYSTGELDGPSTVWVQEGVSSMGRVVVDMIEVRKGDGLVVAATHGRGVFSGTLAPGGPGDGTPGVPGETELYQNFPNPFNGSTTIRYRLSEPGPVLLKIYDALGREVTTLVDEVRNAGLQPAAVWVPAGQASGVYFCSLLAGGTLRSRKILYLK
jgi:hypothetical protein